MSPLLSGVITLTLSAYGVAALLALWRVLRGRRTACWRWT